MAFNGIKYIKNVTKSFGYAMVDVASEMNPVVNSFLETNEATGKEVYAMVKDYKGTMRRIKNSFLESDVYEFAKNYKRNLFEDLKSGKFYNKDRIDQISEKASGWDDESLNSEFNDMFSDEDDLNFDDWDKETLRSDMFMAEHIDDVGSKIANSNAEVTIRSAEYMADVQKQTAKTLYAQNNRLFGQALQGMAAINDNIGQLVGMPELMQVHTNNASTFFEKTSGQLDQITTLLDTLVKNTTPSSEEAQRRQDDNPDFTFRDIFNSKGMPNIKKYMQYVKKNIINNTGEFAMLGDLFGNGVSMLQTLAASPLEDIMKGAIKQLVPTVLKSSMDQFNNTLQGFFGSAVTKLNRADSDNGVLNFIKKIFGFEPDLKTDFDTSAYEKGRVAWDGVSRKALVEVIPGQLAKIVSALTGEDPLVFNPENGMMESIGRINDRANSRIQDAANSAGYGVRKQINQILDKGKYRFKTKEDQDKWEEDLDSFFANIFSNGGLTAEDMTDRSLVNTLTNGAENSKLLSEILDRMSKDKKGKAALLDINRRVLSGIDQYSAQMRDLEAKGSVDNALYSGMFENFLERYNTAEERDKRNATGIKEVTNANRRSAFSAQVDQYGHNIFYYLQNMFQRQDAMYENTSYMVENWGAGGGRGGLRIIGTTPTTPTGGGTRAALRDIEYNDDITSLDQELEDKREREEQYYRESLARAQEEDSDIVVGTSRDSLEKFNLNADVADYTERFNNERDDSKKTFIDKMLEQKTLKGKFGALVNGTKSFFNKPLEGIAKMFDAADDRLYNLIYGEKPSDELKDMGFIGVVKQNIQGTFDKMNSWIDEHVLEPLKEKFGIENRDDFFTKLFDVFGGDYNAFKDKMKDGVFGKKEDGVRSGGLFGDYIQDVKDNAKGAFNWMKDGFKDVGSRMLGGGNAGSAFDRWGRGNVAHYAEGGTVQKTGIAAVSKGELIIPSEMNPFYHGKTDKAQQIRDENQAVRNFFGSYAKGGTVKNSSEIDGVIDSVRNYVKNAGVEISDDELKKYLSQVMIDQRLQDTVDKNGNPILKAKERAKYLAGKAKAYIKKKELTYRRKQLTGQKVKVVDYDEESGDYMTNDGFVGNVKNLNKKGFHIVKDSKTDEYEVREKPESFLGDMVLNLAKAAKTVHHSFVDGSGKKKNNEQVTAFDDVIDDVTGNFKSYAGAMTVGGGIGAAVSALTGMVGGPLVGAAVGSAVGLTMKSDKVQKWLFGDVEEDGSRKGGVFSKETSKFITEKVPSMAKFGMVGGAAGTILGHPMIGTFIGSAVGFAQKSEAFGNFIFNGTDKDGNKTKGLIDMTQEEFNKKVQSKLPKVAAGALVGALTTPLPFGFLPNIMLGSAIGFASDTEKFKTKLFGAIGKDGERHGGVVGAFREEIVKPLGDFIKDQTSGLKDWLENDIMKPMTDSVQPLAKQLGLFGKAIAHPIKWLMKRGTRTDSLFQRMLEGKIVKGAKAIVSNVTDAGLGVVKGTIGIVPQLIGAAGARARMKQISRGNADYMTAQERLDYRDEHNEVGGIGRDMEDVGATFSQGWQNFKTKGHRLSGIGGMLKGVAKAGTFWGKTGGHLIRGAGRGIDEGVNSFKDADKWMANATVDEKKQMRTLLINTVDAQRGKNEKIKDLQRELDANIRSNTFSLLTPRDRNKFISMVKKDGNSLDDLREFLSKCKTRAGKKLTDQQVDEIMGTIQDGVTELRRLQSLKEDADLQQEKADAIGKLQSFKDSNGQKYGWLAKAMEGGTFHRQNAEKLLSMLNYDIDMDDQYNKQQSEEDKAADQAALDKAQHEEEHNEVMNLGKVIANLLAASVGMDQPYKDAKTFTKADEVKPGSNEDIHADEKNKKSSKSTGNAERSPLSEAAEERLNPENLKENTDEPEQQQEVPAAAFGGFIKKAGKAVLHAGEFVVDKAKNSGIADKVKGLFGGDDEESDEEQSQPVVQGAKKAMATAQPQSAPIAGMFNDDSSAAHVGNYLPGQIVWIADRRYKYDGESQELIPDNDTAKQYEARKKKAYANANGGSGATTKPDQQEVKNASDDTKTLESLFQSMGIGGGIGKMLSGLKNLSWIPALAGPLALISFFTGKLDAPISSLIKTVASKLGFSDTDTANMGQSGENGEDSYRNDAVKRAAKNTVSTAGAHTSSGFLKAVTNRFGKNGTKELGKKGILHKVAGGVNRLTSGITGDIGNALNSAESAYLSKVGKANLAIMDAASAGKFGKGLQKFAGNFFDEDFGRDIWENAGKQTEAGSSLLSRTTGFISKAKELANGKAVFDPTTGKLSLPKAISNTAENAAESGAKGIKGLFGKAKNAVKSGKDGIKSALDGLKTSKESKTITESLQKAGESGSKEAKEEAVGKLKEWLQKLVEKGKIDAEYLQHADELADGIMNLGESAGEKAAKDGTGATLKGNLKSMGPVGWAATLAFAVTDFISGYQDANTILGISDATTPEKVIAGLLKSIKGVIEGIIACVPGIGTALSIGLSLIPEKSIVTLFVKVFKNVLSPVKKLDEKRKAMSKKVKAYNKKTGKNYDTEQYLKTVNNDKTVFEKAGSSIKAGLHNLGVSITGKGNKIDTKKNQDSGYDEDGNLIEGYLNKSTKRWKGYYAKLINDGKISSDYAEILYINECLHDGQLKLDDKRKADYEQRIADFKKANPDKTVPDITTNLYGLINKGQVYIKNADGKYKKKHWYSRSAKSVDYGNGKSTADYVGQYAEGGIIQKSGLAALSKGELRTTPTAFLSKLLGGSKSNLAGSLGTIKDYDDLTDLGSFVEDIQSLDPSKTEWKNYWSKVDAGVKLTGVLGTLKKTLYRVAATMFMPSFAMGKTLDAVNSSLSSQIGATTQDTSDTSSSSKTPTSNKTASGKKGNILTRAFKSAKNFFSGIFGKGSGIYGGASGNMDPGATFISQQDSKAQYGDSSYAEEGCAPATAAMLINQVNGSGMTMEDAGNYAVSHGYKVKGDGTKEGFFKDIFNSKGISSENVRGSKQVLENLKAGKPTIILGQDSKNKSKKSSPFGKNPHYVLATGLDKNGNIIVNDPEAKRGGKRYKPSILSRMKSAISTKMAGGASGLYGGGDVAAQVWYYLTKNGFTEQAAAGVMGNLKQETHMNPSTDTGYTCGIACWDYQGGKSALKEAAQKAGVDWTDLSFQLDYLMKGLPSAFKQYTGKPKHMYPTGEWCWWPTKMTFDQFKALTSINEATEIFERVYERASKPLIETRQKYANEYYKQFTGKEGEPISGTSASTDTSSDDSSSSILSGFDSVFNDAMNSVYGSSLMSALSSAGLYSGGESTDAESSDSSDSSGSSASVTTADGAQVSSSTTIGQDVATDAAKYIGNKYVWGGTSLENGIDCSGFVQQLYAKHGYNGLIHHAASQFTDDKHGTTIKGGTYKDLKPGDAMYFSSNGTTSGIHHVGIYAGNGHMIHAQSTKTGIVDTDLSKSPKYQREYIGAKRFGSGSGLFGGASNVAGIFAESDSSKKKAKTSKANVGDIFANSFKSSSKAAANAITKSTATRTTSGTLSNGVESVISRLSSGSNGSAGLNNLIDSIDKIVKLLQTLADNTEPIAQICKLITGMSNDAKESKKKEEQAEKSTRKSMNASTSSSKTDKRSDNSAAIVQLLEAFAQI